MKKLLLLLLVCSISVSLFSQRKTTSVRGYYRKNGTYVRPHTRTYNSSSSSSSSSSKSRSSTYSTSSSNYSSSVSVSPDPKISPSEPDKNKYYGYKISDLSTYSETESENDSISQLNATNPLVVYVSVLRYNGTPISIFPLRKRSYSSELNHDAEHEISKDSLTSDEALDLISTYGWNINDNKLYRTFYSFSTNNKLPEYLSMSIEVLRLK